MYKFGARHKRGEIVLIIDNYDSFTYNIVEYVRELGVCPIVVKNDELSLSEIKNLEFSSIILSPGPGTPENAGVCPSVIKEFIGLKKILGVCLGHQCIASVFGAKIVKYDNPFHGKTSRLIFDSKSALYKGLPQNFEVTRYHSLIVDENTISFPLKINACSDDGLVMGLEHVSLPVFGVQYHPEAILTQFGHEIFRNFLDL